MSNIERHRRDVLDVGRARPAGRIRVIEEQEQLSWSDQRLDRQLESRHIVATRELRREAEEEAQEIALEEALAEAKIVARRKYLYELKQQLARARQESEMLAGGDLALADNFGRLDEDFYQDGRMLGLDLGR
jgi:small-conductance mechanosensitive channel